MKVLFLVLLIAPASSESCGAVASGTTCDCGSGGEQCTSDTKAFCYRGTCENICPQGSKQHPSFATCLACDIGKYNDQTGTAACKDCDDCEAGQVLSCGESAGSTSRTCTDCARGKFKASGDQTACTDCGNGKYNNQKKRTAVADCLACDDCEAGQVLSCGESAGSTSRTCTDCAQGKFKASGDQTACADCGAGKYNDQTQRKTEGDCKICGLGKYNDQTGLVDCKNCGLGKYNDQTQQTAESDCKTCESGKFQDVQGQDSCKSHSLCPGGATCSYPSDADIISTSCALVSFYLVIILFVVLVSIIAQLFLSHFFFFFSLFSPYFYISTHTTGKISKQRRSL